MNGRARFSRRRVKLKPQPTILVICEDKKSSKRYLEEACQHFRCSSFRIEHVGKTDPKGIVEAAFLEKGRYDELICAVDRDSHENFDQALQFAQANDILVIASYPCYEFWLLLHFEYSRRSYMPVGEKSAADRIIEEQLQKHEELQNYRKGESDIFRRLLPRLAVAKDNSARALADAIKVGELNPSSEMHILIEKIENLGISQAQEY